MDKKIYSEKFIKDIIKDRDTYKIISKIGKNGYIFFTTDWKNIPRYDKKGNLIPPEVFKAKIIAQRGKLHFQQNYENNFLGSSDTLIDPTILGQLKYTNDYFKDQEGFKIYKKPIPNHTYIVTVDTKQDGTDNYTIIVTDVTVIPFEVVAVYKSNGDYYDIPHKVYHIGTKYNNAIVVQENNVEASLLRILKNDYEYEGLIYKGDGKNYGVRTTKKSKRILLSFLKRFIEEGLIILNDKDIIDELYHFIKNKSGSYSAEEGYHDDLVMGLSLLFHPFINYKNWDNYKGFNDILKEYKQKLQKREKQKEIELKEFFSLAGGFADF